MIRPRLPRRLKLKRRLRRTALLGLHAVQHHYFSLLSAGVLAMLLALALTSASFEVNGGRRSQSEAQAAFIPVATATALIVAPTPSPQRREVVYYFIGSPAQRNEITMALQADIAGLTLQGITHVTATTSVFIVVEDYRDEAEALEFLRQLAAVPPSSGTTIRVVDLR